MITMTTELTMAAAVAALGLFQIAWGAAAYRRVHGLAYANSARDTAAPEPDSPLVGRLFRAEANLLATAPYFIALAVIITLCGLSSPVTRIASLVYVGGRVLYLPLYAAGVPYLRGLVWTITFIALIVLAWAALGAAPWTHLLG